MGFYVDLIDEFRSRLETARGVGLPLESIKRIRIGSVEEARKLNDYPLINFTITEGEETATDLTRGFSATLAIEIRLLVNKLADENNHLYKISDSTGALFLLEAMLNVLDKNTSDVVDLCFNNTSKDLREISFAINETNDLIEIPVIIGIRTKTFVAGSR